MLVTFFCIFSCKDACSNPCTQLNGEIGRECIECAVETVGHGGCGPHNVDFPVSSTSWRTDPIGKQHVVHPTTCGVNPKRIRYVSNFGRSRRAQRRLWMQTLAMSTPVVLKQLAANTSREIESWKLQDFDAHWGNLQVAVSYTPSFMESSRLPIIGAKKVVLLDAARVKTNLSTFLRAEQYANESSAIEQSSFDVKGSGPFSIPSSIKHIVAPGVVSHNLWISLKEKRTSMHFDDNDGLLIQLSGKKHVTLVDSDTLSALLPQKMKAVTLIRESPGKFKNGGSKYSQENFGIAEIANPIVRSSIRVHQFWLHQGDGLFVPKQWSHDIVSKPSTQGINVAINFWFQTL